MTNTTANDDLILHASIRSDEGEVSRCRCMKPADVCGIVVFGASGDLTSRKIIPALYTLYCNNSMPDAFYVLGCARTDFTDDSFREHMKEALAGASADMNHWNAFAPHLHYHAVDYEDPSTFQGLVPFVQDLDKKHATGGNRLLYLAVPPFVYKPIIESIGEAGLSQEPSCGSCWSRIVVEKPFGTDYDSSAALDNALHEWFEESQIYRIDHYLAKETVQNLLVFRFANSIFEPLWNRQYIESVDLIAAESLGVGHRAGYYERAGVIRDMFQNHMMQLLALTAMEPPARFESEMVRDEKAKLFKSLRPFDCAHADSLLVLGQYVDGTINGEHVPAYRDETGVDPESLMPTFGFLRLFIDNWRWQGVPFYLTSGKRLAGKETKIIIQFREVPHAVFRNVFHDGVRANRLTFSIQPDEKIALTFQAKMPASSICLRSINMEFSYSDDRKLMFDAYEKVLLDCMNGDQMLFLRQDSEELCWRYLTPLLEECEHCADRAGSLRFYRAGSDGPVEVDTLRKS